MHAELDDKDDEGNGYDKDTGEDDESDGHDNRDDNRNPDKIGERLRPLVDIKDRYNIDTEHEAD